MLSYDSPLAMNAQRPASPAKLAPGRQTLATAPGVGRLPTSALSNGVCANSAVVSSTLPAKEHHIWLVTGPAGCGKSTIAKFLANTLHWPYIEGDEYHPKANVDKMSAGIPPPVVVVRQESASRGGT
jgi:gluconokinase